MRRRNTTRILLGILLALLGGSRASAYSVTMRWTGCDDASIVGYRLYVTPAGGAERTPIDVPRPREDGNGLCEGTVADLQAQTTYTFAISAFSASGVESARSNSYTIGYAQVASVVDSDHDGLTDAEEDRNLNLRRDAGETDRLDPDTDGDGVPDGVEREFGANPLDADSPSCGPLEFSQFRIVGAGTAAVGWDPELDDVAVAMTPKAARPTSIGVMYPQYGKGTLRDPLLVTRIRDNDPFRIEIHARSIDGKLYRLRYDGLGDVNRTTRRRLRRSLGDHFTGERYEPVGIDVAAELAGMDPGAVFDHIERLTVRGSLVMERLRVCR